LMMYVGDYDEKFFQFTYSGTGPTAYISNWPEFLEPYIKSMLLFKCPSSAAKPIANHPFVCNYAGNQNLSLVSVAQISAVANTLFL
jgi:hypothetical protein